MSNHTSDHTPGPFEFNRFGDLTIRAKNWGIIATISRHDARLEFARIVLANGSLLTAAPNLLKALKGVMDLIDTGYLVRDISHDAEPGFAILQLKDAVTAIAKAEEK